VERREGDETTIDKNAGWRAGASRGKERGAESRERRERSEKKKEEGRT
jgi:hypothetical protein